MECGIAYFSICSMTQLITGSTLYTCTPYLPVGTGTYIFHLLMKGSYLPKAFQFQMLCQNEHTHMLIIVPVIDVL